ncbi:hypothetical protein JNK13_08320 [bacterium]|nr:hypothetical protein [bacterium]
MKRSTLILLSFVIVSSACGKKAPPSYPGEFVPPPVSSAQSEHLGEKVVLSWTAPAMPAGQESSLAGFVIKRRDSIVGEFRKLDEVEYAPGKSSYQYVDTNPPAKQVGEYVIVAVNPGGLESSYDKLLRVDFK